MERRYRRAHRRSMTCQRADAAACAPILAHAGAASQRGKATRIEGPLQDEQGATGTGAQRAPPPRCLNVVNATFANEAQATSTGLVQVSDDTLCVRLLDTTQVRVGNGEQARGIGQCESRTVRRKIWKIQRKYPCWAVSAPG